MDALILGSLESTQELTHLPCSPNFPYASITRYTHAKHEQFLKLSVESIEIMLEGANTCWASIFLSGFFVKVGLSSLHRAISWYAFGVAWWNSRGIGFVWSLRFNCTWMQFFVQFSCKQYTLFLMCSSQECKTSFLRGMLFWIVFKWLMALQNGVNWQKGFVIGLMRKDSLLPSLR